MSQSPFNIHDLLNSAKDLMEQSQQRIDKIEVNSEAGAGMVKITMDGKHTVTHLVLAKELLKEPTDIIETLIAAAVNDASRKIIEATHTSAASIADLFKNTTDDPR